MRQMGIFCALVCVGGCRDTEPVGGRCDGGSPAEMRVCIDEGWFVMPRWSSTAKYEAPDGSVLSDPTSRVLGEAFLLDVREVTNAEFADFVQATGAASIPEVCGWREADDPLDGFVAEVSGWVQGAPPANRLDHPVVCVSRSDVLAYCSWRGGRPMSVYEYFRAARGPMPDQRAFPWGESPPPGSAGEWPDFELPEGWFSDLAVVGAWDATEVRTRPAGSEVRGASAEGVRGLAGNASELLAECIEEVESIDVGTMELVRPRSTVRATCDLGPLVAGSNWRSATHRDAFGAAVFAWWGDRFLGVSGSFVAASSVMGSFRQANEPGANEEPRSWRVGFRCAYDLE